MPTSTTKTRRDSETITFRIRGDDLVALRKRAETNQVSLNTLVTQILTNYIQWDMHAVDAGYTVVHKTILKKLLDAIDDSALGKIGQESADSGEDVLLLLRGKVSIDGVLELIRERAKRSGFVYREHDEGSAKKVVIQHDMGRNWSNLYQIYYTQMIKKAGYSTKSRSTNNTLVLTITEMD